MPSQRMDPMKRTFNKLPYTHRIALVILLFTLVPFIIMGSIYLNKIQTEWKKDVLSEYRSDVDSGALMMSKNITELQSKMQYLLNNFEIRSYLSQIKTISLSQALDLVAATDSAVSSITADNQDLTIRWYLHESSTVYGDYCFTLEKFLSEFPEGSEDAAYQEILSLKEGTFLWKVRDIKRQANNTGVAQNRLCLYTQINNMRSLGSILEFTIPTENLTDTRKTVHIKDSLFAICLNQQENPVDIILSTTLPDQTAYELLQQYRINRDVTQYEIISASIPNVSDSEVLFLIPESYVSALILPKFIGFAGMSILIAFLILITCYLTSYLLTRRIILAVNSINSDLNNILTDPLTKESNLDDIGQIAVHVRKLVQDTQEYCLKIERYETQNLQMELELLQMRFNPHLLYNSLDAIYQQVKNPAARNSIDALCNYYRIVLNNGHLIIKIKDEIDMITNYLFIVKYAYGLDNIAYDFEIDKQITQYTIIKHLLQPIVENALNHGLRPAKREGLLKIKAFEQDNLIYIQVIDNGIGMSKESAAHLLSEPSASVSGGGYGVYNVQQRIQVYYGKEYGLKIDSFAGKGTTVTMTLPKILAE